jgi:hypothetical protein
MVLPSGASAPPVERSKATQRRAREQLAVAAVLEQRFAVAALDQEPIGEAGAVEGDVARAAGPAAFARAQRMTRTKRRRQPRRAMRAT